MEEKTYLISEVAAMFGLTTYALRYYEREGLLPTVKRLPNGIRRYSERDVMLVQNIQILRELDMPIARIRKYSELFALDDGAHNYEGYAAVCQLLDEQKHTLRDQIRELERRLELLKEISDTEDEYRKAHGLPIEPNPEND